MFMKTIRIHPNFRELLGEETTLAELCLIVGIGAAASLLLFLPTQSERSSLPFWKNAVFFVLIFDEIAGYIANMTRSTNNYYSQRPKLRLIFIAVHVQPLLFALLLPYAALVCVVVWVYTVAASFTVNAYYYHPLQKPVAAALVALGLAGLLSVSGTLPAFLLGGLVFYLLKVTYSFAVDHYPLYPA